MFTEGYSFPLFSFCPLYVVEKCTPLIYAIVTQQILPAIFFQPFHRIAQPFLRGRYISASIVKKSFPFSCNVKPPVCMNSISMLGP